MVTAIVKKANGKGNMLKNNATKEQIRNILAYMEKHSG